MINVLTLSRLVSDRFINFFNPVHYYSESSAYSDCYSDQYSIKNALIERYRICFARLDYDTVFQSDYCETQLQSDLHHYAAEVKLNKHQQQYICISLQDDILNTIVDDSPLILGSQIDGSEVLELFAQLIHNINYSVCHDLNRKGFDIKHGLVQYHLPQSNHSVMVYCTIKKSTR